MTLLLGAVAYDPKVVTIWEGFRSWFREHDLDFDFVLYSNYERQVEDLIGGRTDVAWNSPLAWVRAVRLAASRGVELQPITMRDTDCDLTSVIVTRGDSGLRSIADLRGKTVATGAVDSPQATLIPLQLLRKHGLRPGEDVAVARFDIGVGLHGDHIGGERDAARALAAGSVDAACMIDSNLLLFGQEGVLPADVKVLARTDAYDHCTMTAGPSAHEAELARFAELLLGMSYADPQVRVLLDLEGLKQWQPPRLEGYAQLEAAVDATGFYDDSGGIGAGDYRP
ncbi:MAG TPA: PhnD/SsuA/transferrin family substrate-binding protein [Frankiaceae bacterium]|jgi:ABC-type phosphate/phosphonate transport system substrate-binding protein|nr:PhnD/SsuA/transferrin family substrate-binding protein [Frankiaceae bacterium]